MTGAESRQKTGHVVGTGRLRALMRRLVRALTSPRLAVALLTGLSAYVIAVSFVDVAWAYTNPVFLAMVALLVVSTATCAWRRTRVAWHAAFGATLIERARANPTATFAAGPGGDADGALQLAETALRREGLRVRRAGDALLGTANRAGFLGSPLFHWSLALLFAVAAVGQATHALGLIDVAVGETKRDAAASYAELQTGPLAAGALSGVDVTLERIAQVHVVDGVDRGPAPLVRISAGGRTLARGWVYPNAPLHARALTVHRSDVGLALKARIAVAGASQPSDQSIYLPNVGGSPGEARLVLESAGSARGIVLRVAPAGGKRVALTVASPAQWAGRSWSLGEDEWAELPDGSVFRVTALSRYARLALANDWSIPWLYALFALGLAGVALTVFAPPRAVAVVVAPSASAAAPELRVAEKFARSDPAKRASVMRALEAVFASEGECQ